MGGKNHQPCAIYLIFSTKLSRAASFARARLETANVALEDILLAEMENGRGDGTRLIAELAASRDLIDEAVSTLSQLRAGMERNSYQDLPSLRHISLSATGSDFSRDGIVDEVAWEKITTIMKSGGFWGVIELFDVRLKGLVASTNSLLEKIENLSGIICAGQLSLTVEQNRAGNFKTEFARVYKAWGEFEQEFLASSMLSTELWYQFNGFGSLRRHEATARVA